MCDWRHGITFSTVSSSFQTSFHLSFVYDFDLLMISPRALQPRWYFLGFSFSVLTAYLLLLLLSHLLFLFLYCERFPVYGDELDGRTDGRSRSIEGTSPRCKKMDSVSCFTFWNTFFRLRRQKVQYYGSTDITLNASHVIPAFGM